MTQKQNQFVAHDWAGWNNGYERYTHMPSGDTLVSSRFDGAFAWNKAKLEWFQKYDGSLTIHACPGAYTTDGRLIGTIEEQIEQLKKQMSEDE